MEPVAKIEIICQGYMCATCKHELELKKEKGIDLVFNKLIECPACGGFMKFQEGKERIEVEIIDPSDQFGGYIFDDREPF